MATSVSSAILTLTGNRCQIHIFKYQCQHDGKEAGAQCEMNGRGLNHHCIPQIICSDTVRNEVCAYCMALSPDDDIDAGGDILHTYGNGTISSSKKTHGNGDIQRATSQKHDTRTPLVIRALSHFARRKLRSRRNRVVSKKLISRKPVKQSIFTHTILNQSIVKRPISKHAVLVQATVKIPRGKIPAAMKYATRMKRARINLEAQLGEGMDIDGDNGNEVSELSYGLNSVTC